MDEKTGEVLTMKAELKKSDNFLANFAGCSVGRPVDTLFAAARKKIEKMGHSKEQQRIKELEVEIDFYKEEAKMYRRHTDLVDAELRELRELTREKIESADTGVQASPAVEDASTQSVSMGTGKEDATIVEGRKRKRKGGSKKEEKGKGKVGAKDSSSAGDRFMTQWLEISYLHAQDV